jgi:mono/diheme cytochrome c family protein
MKIRHLLIALIISTLGVTAYALAEGEAQPTEAAVPAAPVGPTPVEMVDKTDLGKLKNPYANSLDDQKIIEMGRKKYLSASCNGCHGGSGGGGMCPPLSNDVWVYGSDDDTLYRLVTLGSVELQKRYGLTRKGRENVVGPMPPHGQIVKTDDDLWKIISFIRANYRGDPSKKNW